MSEWQRLGKLVDEAQETTISPKTKFYEKNVRPQNTRSGNDQRWDDQYWDDREDTPAWFQQNDQYWDDREDIPAWF